MNQKPTCLKFEPEVKQKAGLLEAKSGFAGILDP
jgi:hypothetical protein